MAGIYAQVDSSRGVWKAPANVNISNAISPEVLITDKEQEGLNVDTTAGKSINAIRSFPGRGPAIVWGARTLAGNDNEWRYVSVRRFFIMVEQSVKNAVDQFVFEPNDENTWVRVKSMIQNYLTQQWKAGALMGASTKEAFFVHVGLGQTMTEVDIWEGRLIVEIGLAAVRPAEFIILRFMHKMLSES
jgi:phage tail sheath protein FI